jgi:hypothetical protein
MGLAELNFPTLVRQAAEAIPETATSPGTWSARRVFLGIMGLVQSSRKETLVRMLQRQHDLGLFPDFDKPPSASGFSQARHLFSVATGKAVWLATKARTEALVASSSNEQRWIAMDGSWLIAPRSKTCTKRWTVPAGSSLPQAVVVTAWDVRNRLPVGFCVLPGKTGERAATDELLPHLRKGDVALVDRGFPSDQLFGHMMAKGVEILARMTVGTGAWAETTDFMASKELDAVLPVEVVDPDGTVRRTPMRFIRRVFEVGRPKKGQTRETMVLVTTLLDPLKHSAESLIARYQERWAVETAYREMKVTFAIEHFHSPDANRIVQELYALMTWLCLAAGMEAQVQTLLETKRGPIDPTDPRRWQINRTNLFHFTDQAFWAACSAETWARHQAIYASHCETLVRYAQRKRPGRSSPRSRLAPFGRFARG